MWFSRTLTHTFLINNGLGFFNWFTMCFFMILPLLKVYDKQPFTERKTSKTQLYIHTCVCARVHVLLVLWKDCLHFSNLPTGNIYTHNPIMWNFMICYLICSEQFVSSKKKWFWLSYKKVRVLFRFQKRWDKSYTLIWVLMCVLFQKKKS